MPGSVPVIGPARSGISISTPATAMSAGRWPAVRESSLPTWWPDASRDRSARADLQGINRSGPQVAIDLGRIERNARTIVERCALSGIKVFGVTKGQTAGTPQVARAMLRGGVAGIAESRFENIRRLRDSGINAPIMLLRSPPMARVEEVVRNIVDISLQSELATIREISRIAERMGRVHDIMLMIDLGDLREGIWPSDLIPTVERILEFKGVRDYRHRHQSRLFRRDHADAGKSRPTRRPCSLTRPSACPAKASTGSRAAPRRR